MGQLDSRYTIVKLAACVGLAVFWVIFLWNFWSEELYALGINVSVFLVLFLGFFIWILFEKGRYLKEDLLWIIPLLLIVISFSLYDNPFLKAVTLFIWPVSFIILYNYAFLTHKEEHLWNFSFAINLIIKRLLAIFGNIGNSAFSYLEFIIPANEKYKKIIARILIGFILFAIIALVILIPLLSSADPVFSRTYEMIGDRLEKIFSLPLIYKILFAAFLSVVFSAAMLTWGKEFSYVEKEKKIVAVDSIIAGIFLGGILALYLIFLLIQFNRLWVGSLPFEFEAVENLVKGGFWQLLTLTFINIIIYFFIYKKTSSFVQKLLLAFTIASLLLLASAGHRMGLYAVFYGFSYEKFFASYTVLYCALFLFWLMLRLSIRKRTDILRAAVFLFVWMYGIITIFPVEQFIFRANMALSRRENTRIALSELSMLSSDVLGLVKKYESEGFLRESLWKDWAEGREKNITDKKWYEYNVMNLVYLAKRGQ